MGAFYFHHVEVDWLSLNEGLEDLHALTIVAHPDNPNILYVGMEDGFYRSEDRGEHWENLSGGLPVRSIWISPDGRTIMIARSGGSRSDGIWISQNGGGEFVVFCLLPWPSSIEVDPENPEQLFLASLTHGFFYTPDGGDNWQQAIDGLDGDAIYHLGLKNLEDETYLYASTDAGVFRCVVDEVIEWEGTGPDNLSVRQMAFSFEDERGVYVGTGDETDSDGLYYSDDLGDEWNMMVRAHQVQAVETMPGLVVMASAKIGVLRSTNGGENWIEMNEELDNFDITDLLMQVIDNEIVFYCCTDGSGIFTCSLAGEEDHPQIAVDPEMLDFGEVEVDESTELTLTISNEGDIDLSVSDISVEGDYFISDFEGEFSIEPDGSEEITVTFAPEEISEFEGTLTVVSNDPDDGEVGVQMIGMGVEPPRELIEFKITANDAAAGDFFGYSVAISGDYAIVGAVIGNDDDGEDSGSAYIFIRDDNADWTQQAKLIASDAASDDWFGISVSISGDYAIVGAWYNNSNGNRSGSAYIFVRDGDDWTEQSRLTANDAAAGDQFGSSVSICGNFVIVGAPHNDDDGASSGSAYIFVRDGNDWTQHTILTANDADANDQFGSSVSISGNFAIVGAPLNDDDGTNAGSAYIFVRDGDEDWTQQTKLTANDAEDGNYFGDAVSINGNYVCVGAYPDDGYSGSAYIFVRDNVDWTQQAKLTASDAAAGDFFGLSVSTNGDYAVIGAYRNNDDGQISGSAYIFIRDDADWTEQQKLTANDAEAGDQYGLAVAISSDYAVVGAHGNDDDGGNSGSAYIYDLFPGGEIDEYIPYFAHADSSGENHSFLIDDIEFNFEYEVGEEDEIGIFRPNGVCVGASRWFGERVGLVAWADDDSTEDEEEGFREQEPFHFRYWDSVGEQELMVNHEVMEGDEVFHIDGITLVRLTDFTTLNIRLYEGWNMISINILPMPYDSFWVREEGPDIILMMEQLRIDEDNHHVLLMKDGDGRFYLPDWGFNNIPYWNLTEGYQVKVDEDVEAVWAGELIPADSNIPLEEGWNIIAYFPTYELDASAPDFYVLSTIIDHVLIAKNNDGQFLLPPWDFSNMPPWRETQGYHVKVDEDVMLNYPPEQEDALAFTDPDRKISCHWTAPVSTGNNMSLLITDAPANSNGCEFGVFTASGICAGSTVFEGEDPWGLAIWGDDVTTEGVIEGALDGELLLFKIWDGQQEYLVYHESNSPVTYFTDDLSIVSIAYTPVIPTEFSLSVPYPNPFNSSVRFRFSLVEEGEIRLVIYDLAGRIAAVPVSDRFKVGWHSAVWEAGSMASGIYFARLTNGPEVRIVKMTLIR